jgi:two-component system cell cycle response regulator CpdR
VTIRILLAEDDDAMREYLARALERSGYAVVAVDCGTAALPLLEGEPPFDLLLTDIVMPEMDGIALAQHCGRVSPATEVMFITGFSGVRLKAGKAVPNAKLLSKPFHLRDLVLEVERLFDKPTIQEA